MDRKEDRISYTILKNVGIDMNKYLGAGCIWADHSRERLLKDEAKNWEIVKNNFPTFKDYYSFISFIRITFYNYSELGGRR